MQDKFTEEEYQFIVDTLKGITTHIPKDDNFLNWLWASYMKVTERNEPRPCSCASSGGHWVKAVDTLRAYINQNNEGNG